MGIEVARWMVALGLVAAAVGFTVFGMALAYRNPSQGQLTISYILMGVGLVAAVIGSIGLRAMGEFKELPDEPPAVREATTQAGAPKQPGA